jgi:hypothetical protein
MILLKDRNGPSLSPAYVGKVSDDKALRTAGMP